MTFYYSDSFYRVNRIKIWLILNKNENPRHVIQTIKSLHKYTAFALKVENKTKY